MDKPRIKIKITGLGLAALLGAAGLWAVVSGFENFPKYNRYYSLADYFAEVESAMRASIPFSEKLSSLSVELRLKGGAKELDGIFIGDDILVENIGFPNERRTARNTEALINISEKSRIPTYIMLLPTKCAIKQNEIPAGAPLFNQKQFIEQTYNRLLGKATVVDVYPALFSKYEQDLYYKTSPSLTALGGYSVYEVLTQRLDNTPKLQEDFDIQYVAHDYYGKTYQDSSYKEVSPDVIALYRYQKNNRNYTVTHNEDYRYSYNSLYPEQILELGGDTEVILGGNTGDIVIRSNMTKENTLLVVGDDSILPVLPFLAAHYSQIRFVDLTGKSREEVEVIDCASYQRMLITCSVDTFIHDSMESVVWLRTQE